MILLAKLNVKKKHALVTTLVKLEGPFQAEKSKKQQIQNFHNFKI